MCEPGRLKQPDEINYHRAAVSSHRGVTQNNEKDREVFTWD